MNLYHDSRSIVYRRPQGAAACGSAVELRVRAEGVNCASGSRMPKR